MSAAERAPLPPPERSFVRSAAEVLLRRAGVGASVAVLVVGIAAAVLFLSRPVYRAEARLKIGEPPPTAGVSPTGGLLSFLRQGGDPFANDLEVLSSRTLAEEVVRDAALSVRLDAPRGWYRDSVFVSLELADTTAKAVFEARWADGSVAVRRLKPSAADVGTFAVGTPAVFGGVRAVFAPRRQEGPASVRIRTIPFDEAVRLTAQRLKATRTRREANVLEIAYALDDPGVAAAVVASAVRRFLAERIGLFERESGETVDSIRTVAEGTRRDLAEAEDSLESIQRRTGLVAPDAQSEALVERYETLYAALEEARAERAAMAAQTTRAASAADSTHAWSTLVANPRFLDNTTVGALVERLTELEGERTALLAERRPESLEARTLERQVAQLDEALDGLVAEYRTSLDERIDDLSARKGEMDALLGRLPSQTVELGRRQRGVRILSEVLVLTEQRLRQEELRQALAFSNVQVVDPPKLRYRPVWPRKKLGLAVAALIALGAGLLAALVAERADGSVRSASRARALTGAPALAAPTGPPSPTEVEAVRDVLVPAGALVPCRGAERDAIGVAAALGGERGTIPSREVRSFADAAALVRAGVRPVILVRVGVTQERDLATVAALIREAGGSVGGTVALCATASEARRFWG